MGGLTGRLAGTVPPAAPLPAAGIVHDTGSRLKWASAPPAAPPLAAGAVTAAAGMPNLPRSLGRTASSPPSLLYCTPAVITLSPSHVPCSSRPTCYVLSPPREASPETLKLGVPCLP